MGPEIRIHPGAFLAGALGVMILPLQWWSGAFLAGLIHELAHVTAVYLLGGHILSVKITPFGAVMDCTPLEGGRSLAASAAGPLGSFLASGFIHVFPELGVCALVQGLYNILPVYPLDGGRMLRCFLSEQVSVVIEILTILFCGVCGLWFYQNSALGLVSFLPLGFLLAGWVPRKFTCKESNLAVQ